ncbi:MAG: flagellar filament capping protein FliD [Bryobacteraceae bacterium]
MSSSNSVFMGNSAFATDFQTIINNAVALASLPMQQLQSQVTVLKNQSSTLSDLDTKFASLQTAFQTLENTTTSSEAATVSDPSIVSATVASGALQGTYQIEVTSLGSYTSTMNNDALPTVTDPNTQSISSSTSYDLNVNGTHFAINPAGTDLISLAQAINSSGAKVTASIVNLGSNSSPDYRLTIDGTTLGSDSIQLNDGTSDLLTTETVGTPATYLVNGQTTPVQSDSRTITLAPGLTVNLLQQSAAGAKTTITVAPSTTAVSDALNTIVSDYNAIKTELDQQHGAAAGPLAGQSIVNELENMLRSIASYAGGSGTVTSLSQLGVTLDQTGQMSFDATALDSLSFSDITTFLGTAETGGFLQAASTTLNGIEDPVSGILKTDIANVQDQINHENTMISNDQNSINLLQQSLASKMAAADALIAGLEQQASYFTGLFASMYPTSSSSTGG